MDEIERLKQQHKEELDLAQEVIVNLRRDLAHAHKRIESQDAVWNDAVEAAAGTCDYFSETAYSEGMSEDVVMARHYCASDAARDIRTLKRPMA